MEKHPWITNKSGTVFKQPFFDLININKWNEELPDLYKKINSCEDDRSFVIMTALVVEYHADKLLQIIIPDYKRLSEVKEFNFALKLSLLKSLKLIPHQIFLFSECVRKIRNVFSHNLNIIFISELKNGSKKEKDLYNQLNQLTKEYQNYLEYSKCNDDLRLKFKDIANFVIQAFREYEPNLTALREEIEDASFIEELSQKRKNKIMKLDYIE